MANKKTTTKKPETSKKEEMVEEVKEEHIETATEEIKEKKKVFVTAKVKAGKGVVLNVRQHPDIKSEKVGQIKDGTKIKVEKTAISGFYELEDGSGYVLSDYVAL